MEYAVFNMVGLWALNGGKGAMESGRWVVGGINMEHYYLLLKDDSAV